MGAVGAAIAEWVGGSAAAAEIGGAVVEGGTAVSLAGVGSEAAVGLTASELGSAGLLGTGTSFAAGATAATAVGALGKTATSSAVTAGVGRLMTPTPKMPTLKGPTAMPDPLEQQKAKQRAITTQLARRGRASTVLTDQTDKLG